MTRPLLVLMCSMILAGCVQREPDLPTPAPPRSEPALAQSGLYSISHAVTVEGVGSARGIFAENQFVYVLGTTSKAGAAPTGVVREFFVSTDDDGRATLFPSGRQIDLNESGRPIAQHPTSLTWHPNFGYWLGDNAESGARLIQIDFLRAIRQGNLDGCVLHVVLDDAAISGTCPRFITLPGGRVTLATSDNADQAGAVRLYDPVALLGADRTSTRGVLVSEVACGPWVRSIASRGEAGRFWLVRNRSEGAGFSVTEMQLDESGAVVSENTADFDRPQGELTGLIWREPDREGRVPFVMVNSGDTRNVHFGALNQPTRYVNPIRRQLDR